MCGGHTLVLGAHGELYSFGNGKQGQLGHGSFEHAPTPTPVQELATMGVTIAAAACGLAHTALLDTRSVLEKVTPVPQTAPSGSRWLPLTPVDL